MMMKIDGSYDEKEIVYDDNGGGQVLQTSATVICLQRLQITKPQK